MQIYFFIGAEFETAHCCNRINGARRFFRAGWRLIFPRKVFAERWLERRLVFEPMRFRHRSTSESAVAGVDASNESGLFFARTVEAEVSE